MGFHPKTSVYTLFSHGTAPDTVLGFLPTSLQLPHMFTQEAFSTLFYLFLSQTALQFEIVFPVLNFTIPPLY